MKKLLAFILITSRVSLFSQNYAQYVNPFIGTGGTGHTFPGATLPFALVQLSPDTRNDGSWEGCGGYHYSDNTIFGFTHTHLSGTGCSDYGDILLMPALVPNADPKIYSSKFSHLKEKAGAGYYEVTLDDENIKAELTSTLRTGIHRYTFPKAEKGSIVLDLLHRDKTILSDLKILDSVTVSGFRTSQGWARNQQVFFVMRFSKPFKKMEYALGKKFKKEIDKTKKEAPEGASFEFDIRDGKPLIVKVSLSNTGTDGALRNMEAEAKHWDFDGYKKDAEATWNKALSKIEVSDEDKDKSTLFYTALYHCMIHPGINMDVDGQYRGRDDKIHTTKGFNYYSVFSLWDTYRGLHPLFTIIEQERTKDFINTFLQQYEQSGRLPMWELWCNETNCMIGYHAVSVIADAFVKGIRGYDSIAIYKAMKAAASYTGYGIPAYANKGFLEAEDESESVSKTLEYSYDDWCIAQVALRLNQPADYIHFLKRSQSYKNVFDPSTGFMRPRKNGNRLSPFDPKEVNNHFTEGNSWQYSFFVPHDVDGLMALHGGDRKFEEKLDSLFLTGNKTSGREQADLTGRIGQYAHGNEPSHHTAYLYNFAGKPQKTINKVHYILNEFYKNSPDGLIGNDDCGQMSAWYVLSAMGFYPVCPGSPEYMLGAPLFNSVKINLENGKSFLITRKGFEKENKLNAVSLNGSESLRSAILHSQIVKGGELIFSFAKDSSQYGISSADRPHTRLSLHRIIPAPVIKSESKSFKEKQEISLSAELVKDAAIFYTTDGTEPDKKSLSYSRPFTIENSCTVKARVYTAKDSSKVTSAVFYKTPNKWKIKLASTYSKQYDAGGTEGIIDGIYGDVDWRKGEWQGYQGQDFECVVDLGEMKSLTQLSSNYLQDSRSWILFPTEVEYFISSDGQKFTSAGKVKHTIPASEETPGLKTLELKPGKPLTARYVKIKAKNFGKLPTWHQGAGGDAYIFIDEISLK